MLSAVVSVSKSIAKGRKKNFFGGDRLNTEPDSDDLRVKQASLFTLAIFQMKERIDFIF